ncbi:MAG: hypothetical protein NTV80_24890 [Verrucomicrobia bacterium]|nr:hypothetical protein [Verrucomicrobiota bacterium]
MTYFLTFLAGFIVGVATWLIWVGLRFAADLKAAREAVAHYHDGGDNPKDIAANKVVEECKNRLRWQKRLNPEWLPPLVEEVPKLVREIAAVYHPEHPEPLLAPGLGQFSRAVHLTALDVADFLQTRSIGRLVDVSASTALKTWEMTHKIATHETMQSMGKWYKRLLPVWQVLKFKSPVTWASVAVSNVAARTLQPAIVDIIAKRAIDLYAGDSRTKGPTGPLPLPLPAPSE